MCYILLSINHSTEYPFILAANRDEFYRRKSLQLSYWDQKPHIAGGRDLEQGGTWMAVTTAGKFAAITNFREAASKRVPLRSRGLLINDFIDTEIGIGEYSKYLASHANSYSGYNLIYGYLPDRLAYYSNRINQRPLFLSSGIYSLSNHLLDTPWPKVVRGKQEFEKIITYRLDNLHPPLFNLLADKQTASDKALPDTGVDREFERLLSSIFIEGKDYGTRCSSVITVSQNDRLEFAELTHNGETDFAENPVKISFNLSLSPA